MREPQNNEALKELSAAVAKFIAASVDDPEAVAVGFAGAFMYRTPDGTTIGLYAGHDDTTGIAYDSLTLALIFAEASMFVISDVRREEIMKAQAAQVEEKR